ncbi:unnamed protein product [Microthlaspi erraticum]|uniref:F-box domain-containing protein n=1 Tax=Microthlaspi erraticum TaxID=1685480 RepID=A0A6D2I1R4_9BRAS|nr:unnamed protein product [Microthlaspi erraticum]
MLLRRNRWSVELLPHDVVELILERLPVWSLLRFKSVSKNWKSTIDSRRFQQRQLIQRRQLRGPDFLLYVISDYKEDESIMVLGDSIVFKLRIPDPITMVCHGSCDGLVCIFNIDGPSMVVNPATRWHRIFPLSNAQQLLLNMFKRRVHRCPRPKLGFGKDKFKGTYKPVWLCNSSEFGLDNATTCEVFDFSTNAWRYVLPASPYRIVDDQKPVYLDGSLYWLTECEETKVLSFDLQTETFQVISKAPFPHSPDSNDVIMCILDNRLCVSHKIWPTQSIWTSFDSLSGNGNKTWKKMWSIDLTKTFSLYGDTGLGPLVRPCLPLAILNEDKLLLQGGDISQPVIRQTLSSPDGTFELGFFNPNSSQEHQYVGIWFKKVTPRVYSRENPVTSSTVGLSISSNGILILLDEKQTVLWRRSSGI